MSDTQGKPQKSNLKTWFINWYFKSVKSKVDIQMGTKHMKRGSTSHNTRELKIKLKYYYMSIRMIKIQNIDNTKCWWGRGATGTLTLVGMQDDIATSEDSLAVPCKIKLNSHHIIKPSGSLVLTKRSWKFMSTHKTAHRLFTAALFITKTWKQTRC